MYQKLFLPFVFLEHLYFSIFIFILFLLLFCCLVIGCGLVVLHLILAFKNNIDFSFIIVWLFSYWLWTCSSTPHIGFHKTKIMINIKSYKMKTIKLINKLHYQGLVRV